MQINFNSPILDLDGKPLEVEGEPITLATLAIKALFETLADERGQPEQLSGEEKNKNAILAQAIHTTGDLDLEVEQVAMLKARIGRLCGPLLVMRAYALLEGKAS